MSLSYCQVWVQGTVDKLSLEDCEVQVNGIVNHRYNISREKVVVVDPPKPASDEELRRLRRRIEELESKLSISQIEVRQLRAKAKEPKVSVISKKQLDETRKLEKELARVRNENLDTIGALRDKVEALQRVNKDLTSKLATARREIDSGKAAAFDRQMDAFATIMASLYSEIMARIRKYPAISYLIISLVPLIPGSGLYYTMTYAVGGNMAGFTERGILEAIHIMSLHPQ